MESEKWCRNFSEFERQLLVDVVLQYTDRIEDNRQGVTTCEEACLGNSNEAVCQRFWRKKRRLAVENSKRDISLS